MQQFSCASAPPHANCILYGGGGVGRQYSHKIVCHTNSNARRIRSTIIIMRCTHTTHTRRNDTTRFMYLLSSAPAGSSIRDCSNDSNANRGNFACLYINESVIYTTTTYRTHISRVCADVIKLATLCAARRLSRVTCGDNNAFTQRHTAITTPHVYADTRARVSWPLLKPGAGTGCSLDTTPNTSANQPARQNTCIRAFVMLCMMLQGERQTGER